MASTITRDGKLLLYDKEGEAIDKEAEKEAYWYQADSVIRQICINPENTTIIIGSEDRCAYGLDYKTGRATLAIPDGRMGESGLCL